MVDDRLTGEDFQARREDMVADQLRRRGIRDESVLDQLSRVERHHFVDAEHRSRAYADHPLPIGNGQTISQPYMVARMTELAEVTATDRVLEVGAGSGYQTAILAGLCHHVFAVELHEPLVERASETLRRAGCPNVTLARRDGSAGWPEHAPFDVILVAAGAPRVPDALKQQLAEGGRLIIPVGGHGVQMLQCLTRQGNELRCRKDTACRFVKLRGEFGWDSEEESQE